MRRGFSVLPVLVLVAILGIAAMGIESLAPDANPRSQTATSHTSVAPPAPGSGSTATPAPQEPTPEQVCERLKAQAVSSGGPPTSPWQPISSSELTREQNQCIGVVQTNPGAPGTLAYSCTGLLTRVFLTDRQPRMYSLSVRGLQPGTCRAYFCTHDAAGEEVCTSAPNEVQYSEAPSVVSWVSDSDTLATLSPGELEQIQQLGGLDAAQTEGLQNAFSEAVQVQEVQVQQATAAARPCISGSGSGSPTCLALTENIRRENERLALLRAQQASLSARAVSLSPGGGRSGFPTGIPLVPPPPLTPFREDPALWSGPDPGIAPPGGTGSATFPPPTPTPSDPTPTTPPPSGGGPIPSVIPPPAFSIGDIGPFWRGTIVGALGGGLLGWFLGSDSGAACTAEPPRPNPAACSGSWQADERDGCIRGWRCTPGGGGTGAVAVPVAEVTCNPQIADVGAQLTISYSCSTGTASSPAFTVGQQPSGSASLVVASPPAGLNTATYPLTCTNQGRTARAECSVQVSQPTIILVANPKTVPANGTSLIGWLTSGMKSCVVSSTDQSAFTAENAGNTSTSGVASSSPITAQTNFVLTCQTQGGGVRSATTTVTVSN